MLTPSPSSHYTVYKITAPNGLIYIGCTGQSLKRRAHDRYHGQKRLYDDIVKYGWENFTMVPLCENLTKEGAELLEYKFIEYFQCRNPEIGYNGFTGGARKGAKNAPHSNAQNSRSAKLYYSNPENRRKDMLSQAHKPVRCLDTGRVYYGSGEASRETGVHQGSISHVCRGERRSAGGLRWQFV